MADQNNSTPTDNNAAAPTPTPAPAPRMPNAQLAARLSSLSIPRDRRPGGGTAMVPAAPRPATGQFPTSAPAGEAQAGAAAPAGSGQPAGPAAPSGPGQPAVTPTAVLSALTTLANRGAERAERAERTAEPRTLGGSATSRFDRSQAMRPPSGVGKWIALCVVGLAAAAAVVFWPVLSAKIDALRSGLGGGGGTADEAAPKVRTMLVARQAAGGPPPVLIASGKIVSDQKVYVSTKVSGQILEMRVDQNDRVEAGKTLIAVIESVDYAARVRQSTANLEKAENDVRRLTHEVERLSADTARCCSDKERFSAEVVKAEADIRRAEAEVVRAKSEVARAKSELDRMTVMSKNAEDKLADTREYFRQKATTPFDLRDAVAAADAARVQVETARVAVRTAEAALAGAERALEWANAGRTAAVAALATADNVIKVSDAAVRKAEADVNVAKAAAAAAKALRDQDQWRLDNCRVLAPISGVVLERSANVGDYVTEGGGRGGIANSQFVTLADTDNLRVEVDVTEQDVSKLAKGMPCTIIPDAFKDKAFKGRVMWIDPLGNYSKATVQVKVRIDKTRADDDFLRIEGAAKVEFRPTPPAAAPGSPGAAPTADDKPSIWIPASALAGATDPRVQTLDNEGRVRTATVKLGMRSGSQVQVLEGLTPGQTLVTDWQKDAKDGDLLKPPAAK